MPLYSYSNSNSDMPVGEKKKKHFRNYSTNIALILHKGFGTDGRQIINKLIN